MKAISIRQPWAWLILHAGKDIENRGWPTKVRGRVLIHAAKGMTAREYEDACNFVIEHAGLDVFRAMPNPDELCRGGIVGSVEIVDCTIVSNSPWYTGNFGFVLRDPKPLRFTPYRGQLGFFEVPDNLIEGIDHAK